MKNIPKKTPMIHLDGEQLFASPQWFAFIYTPIESLLISYILYETQISKGVCKITEPELSMTCKVSVYPIKTLKKRISSDKNFAPFLSFSINKNDSRGGVFFEFDKDKFIEFKEKIKNLIGMDHTDNKHGSYRLTVSNIPITSMDHTDNKHGSYRTPYNRTRPRLESIRKKEKEYPQAPFKGDTCVSDLLNEDKKRKIKSVSRFPEWYAVYPRKVAVEAARKAFIKIEQGFPDQIQDIIEKTKGYAQKVMREKADPKFISHPATWLNGHRWKDDDLAPKAEGLTEHFNPVNKLDLRFQELVQSFVAECPQVKDLHLLSFKGSKPMWSGSTIALSQLHVELMKIVEQLKEETGWKKTSE